MQIWVIDLHCSLRVCCCCSSYFVDFVMPKKLPILQPQEHVRGCKPLLQQACIFQRENYCSSTDATETVIANGSTAVWRRSAGTGQLR